MCNTKSSNKSVYVFMDEKQKAKYKRDSSELVGGWWFVGLVWQ